MRIPSEFFELPKDVVHILCLDVSRHADLLATGVAALDPAEREWAGRYVNPWHGQRYAYARGLLRTLSGQFLNCAAAAIEFSYGPHGKPRLAGALNFNLSHSGDRVALGFSWGRRIGIDLARVADCRDCESVARQCFSPGERAFLKRAGNDAQAFCALWTRKEAVLKAAGRGLESLQSFCALESVVALDDERGIPARWCLDEIPVPAGHALALATEGSRVPYVSFGL